jgi:hypothetical protein
MKKRADTMIDIIVTTENVLEVLAQIDLEGAGALKVIIVLALLVSTQTIEVGVDLLIAPHPEGIIHPCIDNIPDVYLQFSNFAA